MEEYLPELLAAVGSGVAAMLLWARSAINKLISSKTKSNLLQSALVFVNDVVFSIVSDVNQRIVKDARRALADGKITKEEYKSMLKSAKKTALLRAKNLALNSLSDGTGLNDRQAGELLDAKIEDAVVRMKPNPIPPSPPA